MWEIWVQLKLQLTHIARSVMFLWEGGSSMYLKEKMSISHATWSIRLKKHLRPLQSKSLNTAIMPNAMNSVRLRWRTLQDRSGAALWPDSLFPLSQPRASTWAGRGTGRGTVGDVTVHLLSSRVGVSLWSWNFCLTVQKSGRISRLSRQPGIPDVLQAAARCSSWLPGQLWSLAHHSEQPEPNSLLKRSKVWIREVLKVMQKQPKRLRCFSFCSY